MTIGRLPTLGAAIAAVSLTLTACGGSSGNGAETTPAPNTTPWRTIAPVPGTDPGGALAIEGGFITYTIKAGDYANRIASNAGGGCSGTELLDFNPDVKVLIQGGALKIPGSCVADGVTEASLNEGEESTDDTATDDSATDESDTTVKGSKKTTTTVDPDSGGFYKIVSGDYWLGIAKKVGCKYQELKAVNRNITTLIPGRNVRIPAKCTPRADATDATG